MIYLCKFQRNASFINQSHISFNQFIVEQNLKKKTTHLNMLLVVFTTLDTYKTIFNSIQINKQNNDKLKKILFTSIGNLSYKRTLLEGCYTNKQIYHIFAQLLYIRRYPCLPHQEEKISTISIITFEIQ